MATLAIPCTKCASKGVGIFKCQGCSNVFCRKHASEHRDNLNHQLDELNTEHDQLYNLINQNNNGHHTLINQIDQWEKISIKKIQQVAQNIRQDIIQYIRTQKEIASETLKNFYQRLRKAREEDDYIENDLQLWKSKLDTLKKDITTLNSSISVREDSKGALISNIYLSLKKQQILSNDSFLSSFGDIHIDENGQSATHDDQKRSDAYLCGKNEYRQGKHKIRFIINKKNIDYITTFGIASMEPQLSVYGWNSDDQTVGGGHSESKNSDDQRDMKGETTLQMELLIDCDNKKLSYVNERTRCKKEMNVDIDLCPFPWQLYFYLYDTGDRVRLLTSNRT
ncbi:unnamed protein product [Rotaria sordida]|uniref:B box-type domain-containing protein n=1 Tax=Rotaria sordida TaxID=392033 RepID=A0A815CS31_9BILA|nr:unnamed protein product [Rotaria sordida]CAF1193491.1 unnamed protein product [Rotaria sordida]CAF1241905.1 unnamed protein product [Rotaria sordida]CAF1288211.1 unnamed protein product [Rotaria sordida]CAF1398973.1 unnamed protein product [Rotaria sordida]